MQSAIHLLQKELDSLQLKYQESLEECAGMMKTNTEIQKQCNRLNAENERMRKAIETVSDPEWYFQGSHDWTEARDILKNALP